MTTYRPFVDATDLQSHTGALRRAANAHGHLLFRGLLPHDSVKALRDIAIDAARAQGIVSGEGATTLHLQAPRRWQGYGDTRWIAMQQSILASKEAQSLPRQQRLLAIFEALYQGPVMTHRGDICRLGVPHSVAPEHTTPAHQDHFYVGGSTQLWTAWTPLVPCPIELGPLALIDGSHRRGFINHGGEGIGRQHINGLDEARWSSQDLELGDVVIFHCMAIHRALPNLTEADLRLSFDMRFQPADATLDVTRVDGTRP